MDTNKNIQNEIEALISSTSFIKESKVSPFFKDKTLELLFAEKEVVQATRFWYSPRLQLATLVCLIVLNVITFNNLQDTKYDENVNSFAESYGFLASTETALLN